MRILDESGAVVASPDLELGYLAADRVLVAHHPAKPERQRIEWPDLGNPTKTYPNGGKIVNFVVEQEYSPAEDAWDEYEDVMRYVLYTQDELDEIAARKAAEEEAMAEAERIAAEELRKREERESFIDGAPERLSAVEGATEEILLVLADVIGA